MTKFLRLLFFIQLFTFGKTDAQVFYSQTFDGTGGATNGGPGTYTFPAGFLLRNVDNLAPANDVSAINDAWERLDDTESDSAAFSTSWYDPAGTANDFMWTPAITLTGNNITLTWNGIAYDTNFPDGYEVRITTVEPTGGTGVIGNQLTGSTLLLAVPAENGDWTARSLDLTAYTGQTVYIGFRNNSNDQFVLGIDDIVIQNNTILALNSLSLSGKYQYGKNVLHCTLIGTDKYNLSLQTSATGTSWNDIYQAETTPEKSEFSYAHSIIAPKTLYRVKAVSPSGKTYISNTIIISQKNNSEVSLYPTPAGNKVTIQGNLKNSNLIITDASGKMMLSQLVTDESKSIDVTQWQAGFYFVKIITRDRSVYFKKLIVKH